MLRSNLTHSADDSARIQGKLPDPRRLSRLAEACASFNIDGSVFERTGDGKENLLDAKIKGVLGEAYPEDAIGKGVAPKNALFSYSSRTLGLNHSDLYG